MKRHKRKKKVKKPRWPGGCSSCTFIGRTKIHDYYACGGTLFKLHYDKEADMVREDSLEMHPSKEEIQIIKRAIKRNLYLSKLYHAMVLDHEEI